MRHTLWSLAGGALGLGALAIVGGTAVGGQIGPMAVGYGLLVALAALYLVAALAIRERVWRRLSARRTDAPDAERLAGRRVF